MIAISAQRQRTIVQNHQMVGSHGQGGVGPAFVVAELHFIDIGCQRLHDSSHLSARQAALRHVLGECHNIQNLYCFTHDHLPLVPPSRETSTLPAPATSSSPALTKAARCAGSAV